LNLLVFSFSTSLDILKILANVLREIECSRVLPHEIGKKGTKTATPLLLRLMTANVTEPIFWKGAFVDGRINAFEMERASATVATDQVSIPAAR
jgi:hypothetical protein